MPQNIYDDPAFFAGYEHLRRTGTGLNAAVEQPALRALLPPSLAGLRVLDLGCGFGDFAREARRLGAREVVGVDVSARMLGAAAERTVDPGITYRHGSIEALDVVLARDGDPFELIVSSLALHYVQDYAGALARIARVLAPEGRLAFSVEHPICTALPEQRWALDESGHPAYWPVDRYGEEGPRRTRWFVEGVIKYHRTVETYVGGLLDAGFVVRRLLEPPPLPDALAADPALGLHRRRPPFLLLAANRQPNRIRRRSDQRPGAGR